VSLEIQVNNRFIVVCCDFTSSTLGCRWRSSNPRSSLRFNIPLSTHQPLSSPIPVNLGRGPSHHVVVCYTSCFAHLDKYCFVLFGNVATLPTVSIRWSGYENVYKVWDSLFFVLLWGHQTVSLPITSGTHKSVCSLFLFFAFVFPSHNYHAKYIRHAHRWCTVIRWPRSAWLQDTPPIMMDLGHVNVVLKWMYLYVECGLRNWKLLRRICCSYFLAFRNPT